MKYFPLWSVGTANGIILSAEAAAAVPWLILVLFYCVLYFYSVLHRKNNNTPEG